MKIVFLLLLSVLNKNLKISLKEELCLSQKSDGKCSVCMYSFIIDGKC